MPHPNVLKLRAANIPPFAYNTTLKLEGRDLLADQIASHEFLQGDNLRNYWITADEASLHAAWRAQALFAKELRLSGEKVTFTTIAGVLRELRIYSMEREVAPLNHLMQHKGDGYIFVTDLTRWRKPEDHWTLSQLQDIGDFLASHVAYGGGIVVGGLAIAEDEIAIFNHYVASAVFNAMTVHIA